MNKLPYPVFSYIRRNFPEGYVRDVISVKNGNSCLLFRLNIYDNEVIHHLEFDNEGRCLKHDTDPMFEEDYYEGGFYGEE